MVAIFYYAIAFCVFVGIACVFELIRYFFIW